MGFLSKAWKGIKKGWDAIDDYAIPVIAGAALGAVTMGAGAALMGGVGAASSGAATGAAAAGAASSGGFSGFLASSASSMLGAVSSAAGAATGGISGAVTSGALMGGLAGFQMGNANVQAEKASAASEAAAKRQEKLANSAATTVTVAKSTQAAKTDTGVTARQRRFSHGKTTRSSGLGLSRYATSTSKRTTLG